MNKRRRPYQTSRCCCENELNSHSPWARHLSLPFFGYRHLKKGNEEKTRKVYLATAHQLGGFMHVSMNLPQR